MTRGPFVVVGDAVLDRELTGRVERLCPEAPVPVVDDPAEGASAGGAALAATLAAGDGRDVVLVTALADDAAGRELAMLARAGGAEIVPLRLAGATPEKVRVRGEGRLLLRLDRGGGTVEAATERALAAIAAAEAVLVADYGRGVAADPAVRTVLAHAAARRPAVWDPHPRGSEPVPGIRLATPNGPEAAAFVAEVAGDGLRAAAARARALRTRWRAGAVAVTLGARGAVLVEGEGPPFVAPARAVSGVDPCGAGDRFASAAAGFLADGALVSEAVAGAVRAASDYVARGGFAASGAPGSAPHIVETAEEVVVRVRAVGGTVVATGGCFDLLHAGHVALLDSARSLGDCLIVCLNSDDSVRRLKGSDRPLVPEEDRAAVLRALASVDAVALFDEDTPAALLERLRPDVFAKGADYAVADLPEAAVLSHWGGEAVVLPFVAGRSTTRLIEEALRGAS